MLADALGSFRWRHVSVSISEGSQFTLSTGSRLAGDNFRALRACQIVACCGQLATCLPLDRRQAAQLCNVTSCLLGPVRQTLCQLARLPEAKHAADQAMIHLAAFDALLLVARRSGHLRKFASRQAPAQDVLRLLELWGGALDRHLNSKAELSQLLAEVVAALPRILPASLAEEHDPHTAAAAAGQLGEAVMQLQCGEAAYGVLGALYTLFPEGTAVNGPKQLAVWCELVHASWLLLATAAGVPQLPKDRQDAAAAFTADFNCSLAAALDGCLPQLGADASGRQQAAHSAAGASIDQQAAPSGAGSSNWDAVLRLLLRLSRQLCRAGHFLAQADPASPVAAALLEALMPHFIVPAFDPLLVVMNKLDNLSTKQQQQALLSAAATYSALEALPPAACKLGVFGPICKAAPAWLAHPNRLSNDPAILRQLVKLAALALDRYLQDPFCVVEGHVPPKTPDVLQTALQLGAAHLCLAEACLGHPALPALLERCAAEEAGQAAGGIATQLRSLLDGLLSQAAERSTAGQEQGGSSSAELQAAATHLSRLLAALPSGGGDAEGSSFTNQQQLRQLASPALLQQAAAVVAALAAQAEPTQEQQAADALVLAWAVAAAPGCNNLACPDWTGEMGHLAQLAVPSGSLSDFAGRLAPEADVARWLSTISLLMERYLYSKEGLDDSDDAALYRFCLLLHILCVQQQEYPGVQQQLVQNDSTAAAIQQLVLTRLMVLASERWLQVPYPTVSNTALTTQHVLRAALLPAATYPSLAAACLGHPAVPALLERCAAEEGQAAGDIATQLRSLLDGLLSQVASASTGEQEQGGSSPAELQAAAANLLASLPTCGGAAEGGSSAAEQLPSSNSDSEHGGSPTQPQQLRQLASPALLQQAAALAAALAAQTEPTQEQQAADALALARAVAAAPGCNNLACPDWTGEVDRLKLCEACRTARYCSARCQREAWRAGGHRQCCSALAAERAGRQG
ncbi:histone-lysine N-methyltransferase SET domain containing [Chlorella sorokiniana]|uniref:Histone-lysine N-methyltransferase SET domain containing n=1 Tax=Chlorella sorokiniana TaxID=3076 RepID=A0A2P6TCX8_CHLSO|nr:histone-lysine N-methyltransferase SET domain containing [Chlorella sorokiniana]|eukprot:PRW20495.1 histone-lysine N-methyltransferase SET domain containing [Chlorella sorokiniana]